MRLRTCNGRLAAAKAKDTVRPVSYAWYHKRTYAPARLGNKIAGREGAVCPQASVIGRRRTSQTRPETSGLGKNPVPAKPAEMISQVLQSCRKLVWHRQERRVARMQCT